MIPCPDRCFGVPHAETMHAEIEDVLSSEFGLFGIDDLDEMGDDTFPIEVEEWTTRTGRDLLPRCGWILEYIEDGCEITEHIEFHRTAEIEAAVERLLDLVAESLTGYMAEMLVTTHVLDRETVAKLLGGAS